MHFGAAHIVWEDENFEREHVQWCIDHLEPKDHMPSWTYDAHEAVRQSLLELLALPDELLDPYPDSYEWGDSNPADFPPGIEMERP